MTPERFKEMEEIDAKFGDLDSMFCELIVAYRESRNLLIEAGDMLDEARDWDELNVCPIGAIIDITKRIDEAVGEEK